VHNEPLSVVAMRVSNQDCSPLGINRCDPPPMWSPWVAFQNMGSVRPWLA
jgi:hypothetical protein